MIAVDVRCSESGCSEPRRRNDLCATHSHRRRRALAAQTPCSVFGCSRGSDIGGLCGMHYARVNRRAEIGPAEPLHAPPGSKHVDKVGYVHVSVPGHPLAGAQGSAMEHRVVLFDAIGNELHDCFWCGRHLMWKAPGRNRLIVDHLDEDKGNNDRWNLVPSCAPCNTRGAQPYRRLMLIVSLAIAGRIR